MSTTKTKPFNLDLNLDDKQEVSDFLSKFERFSGKCIAKELGLRGKGSELLANSLLCYAINKMKAITYREKGSIIFAMGAEEICDSIYSEHINPVCDCW
jgi:hypothetical protein